MTDEKHSSIQLVAHKSQLSLAIQHLTKGVKIPLENIALQGVNFPDGGGDFQHLAEMLEACEQNFPSHAKAGKIKAFAFVDNNKLELAKRIMPKSLANRVYICNNPNEFDENAAKKASLIIFTGGWSNKDDSALLKCMNIASNQEHIKKFLSETGLFFNISTTLIKSIKGLPTALPKTCAIHSLLEYGGMPELLDEKSSAIVIKESSMGLRPSDMGIKINEKIWQNKKSLTTIEQQATALMSFENKALLKLLLRPETNDAIASDKIKKYLTDTKFCMGYLQTLVSTQNFIRLMATIHDNTPLDIMINGDFFKQIDTSTKAELVKLGYTGIEYLSANGQMKFEKLDGSNSSDEKVLRLVQFNGISQNDKETLSIIAEAMSGSGDNSFSDIVASKAFPFLSFPAWKISLALSVSNLAERENKPELARYLKMGVTMMGTNQEADFIKFAKENYATIKAQWGSLCEAIHSRYNVKNHFDSLTTQYLLQRQSTKIGDYQTTLPLLIAANQELDLEKLRNPNDFLNIIYESANTILQALPPNQQLLDLVLYSAVMKNDISTCFMAQRRGAKLILDPKLIKLLDPIEQRSSIHMSLQVGQEAKMHGKDDFNAVFAWLLSRYESVSQEAMSQRDSHGDTPLEYALKYSINFNLISPYIYTIEHNYEQLLKKAGIKCLNVDLASDGSFSLTVDILTYAKIHTIFPNITWSKNANGDSGTTTIQLSKAQLDQLATSNKMISGDPKNEKVKDYLLLNRQKYGIKDIKNTNDGLIIFFDGSDIKKVFSKVVSTELKVTLAFSDSGKAPISSDLQDEKTSALTNDGILLKNSGVKKITEGLKIIEQPKAHPQSSSGFVKH